MQLTGHTGSVYALEYSPNGSTLCSASFDKTLLLWSHRDDDDVYSEGEEEEAANLPHLSRAGVASSSSTSSYTNFNVLRGHKNAVVDCHWMTNETIVSCSSDKTVQLWDAGTGQRIRKWQDTSMVNACTRVSMHLAVSVNDGRDVCVWDGRTKRAAQVWSQASPYALLAVTYNDKQDVGHLFTAGIDPTIVCWDWKVPERKLYGLTGHVDPVTCLAVHPEGTHVLSNAMDSTCRLWDIQPFCPTPHQRQAALSPVRGHVHGPDKGLLKCAWSSTGDLVSAGSADGRVHIWDVVSSGQELYDLPGHKGTVHTVTFHPQEATVVASGGQDQHIWVGELETV